MAREMHDGLAQMLAYVSAETAGISVLMESGDSEGVRREIDKLNRNARELSGEIRQSILGLRIASSDPDEFATMYTDYLRDFAARNQLDLRLVGFAVLDRVRLNPSVQHQLIQIVQEAFREHSETCICSIGSCLPLAGEWTSLGHGGGRWSRVRRGTCLVGRGEAFWY